MAPERPCLSDLPVKAICLIARLLLADDIPAPGARGLLFDESYVSTLRDWRTPPGELASSPCTPERCCFTRRGARSGQTVTCYKDDFGPARSALDLLEVCSRIRAVLSKDALLWGEALLLRPSLIDQAVDRALHCAHPRLSFAAQGGICLCALDWLIHNIEFVTRIDLALPSTTIADDDSPSHMICTEIQQGAPHLQAVDLRFDWAHAHADAQHKSIVLLPAVRTCRLLNATFAIGGKSLTSLFLAAEEAAFRWRRADIFAILRACPNIETLALQMIFANIEAMSQAQLLSYPHAGVAVLPRLTYCMIMDSLTEWLYASVNIHAPSEVRLHPDVILPMSQLADYSSDDFELDCEDAVASPTLQNIGAKYTTLAMRVRRARADKWTRWPEYISLSFGDSALSAMTFRDAVSQKSAGTFTVRNAALSLPARETPWIEIGFGGLPCHRAVDVMMHGCAHLGISRVETFVVDVTDPLQCPEQWGNILMHLRAVHTIVMYGVRLLSSPRVLDLAHGLGETSLVSNDDPDQGMGREYGCPRLRTVHLPDGQHQVPNSTIVLLNSILRDRYTKLGKHIMWEV